MGKVEQSIEVNVPLTMAYNQWTQFEEFPKFMQGVEYVRQIDDKTLEWKASVAGRDETWTAEIDEQRPDERVAWHATSGATNAGVVTFHRIDDGKTKVMLQLDWEPEGVIEKTGDALGFDDRRIKGDLEKFKEFIEARATETGAWRGEIEHGQEVGSGSGTA
ncbi:MAG: SRPBCC family protein [Candidatus Limnocylindrales bacterium]